MNNKTATSPTPANQCRHIKADRSRCRVHAVHNSTFCFFHDPNLAAAREAARRKGGRERSRKATVLPHDTPNRPLTNPAEVTELLAETINQVRRGEIDPRTATTGGYLAGMLLNVMEKHKPEPPAPELVLGGLSFGGPENRNPADAQARSSSEAQAPATVAEQEDRAKAEILRAITELEAASHLERPHAEAKLQKLPLARSVAKARDD